MSGMVTMRARKLRTCQLDMPRWSVGRWPTSAGKRTSFHGGWSSPRSNAFRFVPRTPRCWHSWVQLFPVPLEKSGGCPWVSCTCFFFWQLQSQRHWHWWYGTLLQISVSQSVDHCDVLSGAEFHGSNVKPSGRLPSSRTSPCGSFMLGTPTRVKARQMTAML